MPRLQVRLLQLQQHLLLLVQSSHCSFPWANEPANPVAETGKRWLLAHYLKKAGRTVGNCLLAAQMKR